MIRIELDLSEVDYAKLFESQFDRVKEALAASEEAPAKLMSGLPTGLARTVWNGLKDQQKEKILANVLNGQGKKVSRLAEEKLRENGIDLTVDSVRVLSLREPN